MFRSHRQEKQTRYLSQAVQLEEAANPTIVRLTMVTASLAIIAFIGWSAFTNINEVARTPRRSRAKGLPTGRPAP